LRQDKAANRPTPAVANRAEPEEALRVEARKIEGQVNEALTAQNANNIAIQALCRTMRFGNKPGLLDDNKDVASPDSAAKAPVSEHKELPGPLGVTFAKLSTSSYQFSRSEKVTVTWTHNTPTSGDWIGIYRVNSGEKEYLSWDWVDLKTNVVSFTVPSECGEYHFRYYHKSSYVCHGTGKTFTVGPVFTLTPTTVAQTEIKIRVDQVFGPICPNLWVALYPHGEIIPKKYITYHWTATGQELTFPISKAGTWHFKAFPDRGFDHGGSLNVLVKGSDSVTLALDKDTNKAVVTYDVSTVDPAQDSAWIGIFHVDQQDSRYYRRYKYISTKKGSFEVKAMQTAGTYEARLFACGTYDVMCKSETTVTVQ